MSPVRRLVLMASLGVAAALAPSASALAQPAPLAQQGFTVARAGEARLALSAASPDTDWGTDGHESVVLTVRVDGRVSQDVVLFHGGEAPFTYRVALGPLRAGRHQVSVRVNGRKTPVASRGARVNVTGLEASLAPRDDLAARYAPILYGRDLPEIAGRYENAFTDVPLLEYHTLTRDDQDRRVLEYTVIWSNEDGGTDTPSLMARWGRTTDVEWVYRVTLDDGGQIVDEVYQAPDHQTLSFHGAKVGLHPLLQTGTINNNIVPVAQPSESSGYRFFLDPAQILPEDRAREAVMDANPWTYQVMAQEMRREGKVEATADPATPAMSDQRNYLFAEVAKTTSYAVPPPEDAWVGVALQVKLAGDDTWYASNHGVADSSIERDIPAATTVELPPGTTQDDVEAIRAVAVPVGGAAAPQRWSIHVGAINRAFFLGADDLPQASFVGWHGSVKLTPEAPAAVLWTRARS